MLNDTYTHLRRGQVPEHDDPAHALLLQRAHELGVRLEQAQQAHGRDLARLLVQDLQLADGQLVGLQADGGPLSHVSGALRNHIIISVSGFHMIGGLG